MKKGDVVYFTKFALTKGIMELPVQDVSTSGEMVSFDGWWGYFKIGRDVFATKNEALAAADQARMKKVMLLQKHIVRLKMMKFKVLGEEDA